MHIGLVCSEYPPAVHGGIGTFTRDLARGLAAKGHAVSVVGVYQPQQLRIETLVEEFDGAVRVVRIPSSPSWIPGRFRLLLDRWRLTRWFRKDHSRRGYDVVEAPEWGADLLFGGPSGVPTVNRIHGGHLFFDMELNRRGSRLIHLFEKRWLRQATALTAVSDYVGRRTLEFAGLQDIPYQVIHNAVDVSRFTPGSGEFEPGLIVFANSIRPKKGVLELAQSLEWLIEDYPEVRLVFIGKNIYCSPDGTPFSDSVKQAVSPGARERIVFTGWLDSRDEVLDLLRKANVCCYPSHMEGFGIAPVEAMALAKPTVFTTTGPGPEVVEDGVSGLLCDPRDPQSIAASIRKIVDDEAMAIRLGAQGRSRVLERFDRKDWVTRNEAFFSELVMTSDSIE